ncbi:MAG: HU family DNA-binding protein [Methylacidiphilales bacterium]|nr:HU family DNA-binding protein [Candidatus Methylacidiphilales bacterium]
MHNNKVIEELKKFHPQISEDELVHFVDLIVKIIKNYLKDGNRIEIRGFGVFLRKTVKARTGINPKTRQRCSYPETKTPQCKISKQILIEIQKNQKK